MARVSKIYRVSPEGCITGLWDDKLVGLGQSNIARASNVEYEKGGWTVEILVGPDKGKKLGEYEKRGDALKAEIAYFSDLLLKGEI